MLIGVMRLGSTWGKSYLSSVVGIVNHGEIPANRHPMGAMNIIRVVRTQHGTIGRSLECVLSFLRSFYSLLYVDDTRRALDWSGSSSILESVTACFELAVA